MMIRKQSRKKSSHRRQRNSAETKPRARFDVAIVMGSDSDLAVMKDAAEALSDFNVSHEIMILSAHRTPEEMSRFGKTAFKNGVRVIIAGAGGAAHLPGMLASYAEIPVIGVPVPIGALQGQDALLSIVQMPRGVPVATVAIGNAYNAGLLAIQILGAGGKQANRKLLEKMRAYKASLRTSVKAKNTRLKKTSKRS